MIKLLALFALGLAAAATAKNDCEKDHLKGHYVYAYNGAIKDPDSGKMVPFARAGRDTFDSRGKITGRVTYNLNSVLKWDNAEYTGTVTVDEKLCLAEIDYGGLSEFAKWRCYMTPKAERIACTPLDNGVIASVELVRAK